MKNIMIDIETLALTPDATILSIGAVKFDKTSMGEEFYMELKPDQGRAIDPKTALWWAQQSAAFSMEYPIGLDMSLRTLYDFVGVGDLIWANSPVFDLAILRHAFTSNANIECPWEYYQERDVRTIKAILKGDKKFHDPRTDSALPAFIGRPHNALDDAKHQVRIVQAFYQKTGLEL